MLATLFTGTAFLFSAIPTVLLCTDKLKLEPKDDDCEQELEAIKDNKRALKLSYSVATISSLVATILTVVGL